MTKKRGRIPHSRSEKIYIYPLRDNTTGKMCGIDPQAGDLGVVRFLGLYGLGQISHERNTSRTRPSEKTLVNKYTDKQHNIIMTLTKHAKHSHIVCLGDFCYAIYIYTYIAIVGPTTVDSNMTCI